MKDLRVPVASDLNDLFNQSAVLELLPLGCFSKNASYFTITGTHKLLLTDSGFNACRLFDIAWMQTEGWMNTPLIGSTWIAMWYTCTYTHPSKCWRSEASKRASERALCDWFKEIINWVRTQSWCVVKFFFHLIHLLVFFLPDLCCNVVVWDFVNASVLSEPPFHLTRRGWGEFPVRIQIHFKDPRNKRIDIIHQLKVWPRHPSACFYPSD